MHLDILYVYSNSLNLFLILKYIHILFTILNPSLLRNTLIGTGPGVFFFSICHPRLCSHNSLLSPIVIEILLQQHKQQKPAKLSKYKHSTQKHQGHTKSKHHSWANRKQDNKTSEVHLKPDQFIGRNTTQGLEARHQADGQRNNSTNLRRGTTRDSN